MLLQENNSNENPNSTASCQKQHKHIVSEHVPAYLLCQWPQKKNKGALNPKVWPLSNEEKKTP